MNTFGFKQRVLRNRINHGFLVPAKAERRDRVFGFGDNAKKIASGGKWGILVRSREAKRKFRLK